MYEMGILLYEMNYHDLFHTTEVLFSFPQNPSTELKEANFTIGVQYCPKYLCKNTPSGVKSVGLDV